MHAAIVETLAARYAAQGRLVAADEPFQHFQFAGRADVTAVDPAGPDLLHHEVKTAIPNVGELAGAWNVKRQYLAASIAQRHGFRGGFRSVTHVAHDRLDRRLPARPPPSRSHRSAACGPDAPDAFARWWEGGAARAPPG